MISAFRGLGLAVRERGDGTAPFDLLGQRVYSPGSPAGWPDTRADWDGASALLKRIEWADAIAQQVGSLRVAAGRPRRRARHAEARTRYCVAAVSRACRD